MTILKDIQSLREHYSNKLNWYFAAIERLESDIQVLWNEYFLTKKSPINNLKLLELEKSFSIMRGAIEYFRQCAVLAEKRLDELDHQEYAIINKKNEPIN